MTLELLSRPHPLYTDAVASVSRIVGTSLPLRQVLQLVEMVAASDATVLLLGETGTGKELIARAIHELSKRHNQSFVTLNCAAIPSSLFESELFGHERGAFTGASIQRAGRIELADRGTLFLDEVGDMPLEMQPKLLRTLQEHTFERLGSARTKSVDVRLVAATNRDLEELMAEKQFRSDLYYRLNVFPVVMPPLRERREDIRLLVQHFVERFGRRIGKKVEHIPEDTMSALRSYDWPGNIRELQNLIERAMILSDDGVLSNPLPPSTKRSLTTSPVTGTLMDTERVTILRTLEDVGWIIEQAGPEVCLFSSDYPHVEGGRRPIERFERSIAGVDDQARQAFYHDNFVDLMGAGLAAAV